MSVSLHHLHAFQSVAATGGVRRSAELLFRASSAVARSIAILERQLNADLFERKGRGMLLTAAGRIVQARVASIESELGEVRADAARLLARTGGGQVGAIGNLFHASRLAAAAMLAELQHMPTVAQALGVSQPAVSSAIARLEASLGQPLFLRTARGMIATDAGARWITRFDRVLAELRNIEADVAALNGVLTGAVTVGALPLGRTLVLPMAVAAVQAQHPALQVRSLESPYEELHAALISGRVDFILGALRPPPGTELAVEALFEDEVVLVARAGHPLCAGKRIAVDDLHAYPWVLSRTGTPLRKSLEAFFESRGSRPPRAAVETGDLALLRGLLLQSDMLTALSAHQLHYEIQAGDLVVLPFGFSGMEREIGITTRSGARLSPGANALIAEIRRIGRLQARPLSSRARSRRNSCP